MKDKLKEKQEQLTQLVSKFNQAQQILNGLQQEVFKTDGAIQVLQELIESNEQKGDKEQKKL